MPLASTDVRIRHLFEGKSFVASFDSTSQYAQGGSSACGLASLNAVRMVLDRELKGARNVELLELVASRKFAEDVSSICSIWASNEHLEIDDIYKLPLFDKSLVLVHSVYEKSSKAKFKQLLRDLHQHSERASAKNDRKIPIGAVITRPPEIFSIFNLPTPGQGLDNVFVVYDSHSRPSKHPNGSAFLFFPTLDQTADYLSELLHVDSNLLDGGMNWQMQLLSQYSGQFFVARRHREYDIDSVDALYDANMCILELSLSQAETKTIIAEHQARIKTLEDENSALKAQIRRLEKGKAVDKHPLNPQSAAISQSSAVKVPNGFLESSSRAHPSSSNSIVSPYTPATGRARGVTHSRETPKDTEDGSSEQASLILARKLQEEHWNEAWPPLSSSPAPGPSSRSNSRVSPPVPMSRTPQINSGHWKGPDRSDSNYVGQEILLAKKMQADFSAENSDLRGQLRSSQPATFKCGICSDELPMDYVCVIDDRGHNVCRACLKDYITVQLREHRFPIFCPLCYADKADDPQLITRTQAEQSGLSQDQAELWTELELVKHSLMLPCPSCKKSAFVARDDHDEMDILYCPLGCGYVWCKACQHQVQHSVKHSCDGTEQINSGHWKEPDRSDSNCGEQESLLLANKMQADFSAEDSDLRGQLHGLRSSQPATFECGICFDELPMDYVCVIDDRGHNVCRACLKDYITAQLQEHRFPIFCPLCSADGTGDPRLVTRTQAEQLGLSQDQAELWTELELVKHSVMLPCPRCKKFAFIARDDHDEMDILYCPLGCGYVWCKACQQQVQHGFKHSCDGAEEMKRLMKDKGYRACPGCKTPIERTQGCNHMSCGAPHCDTHFCYKCGGYIIQSLDRQRIKKAVEDHYRVCALLDYSV